jgi:hypothetical protein
MTKYTTSSNPPPIISPSAITLRRVSSIALAILLYTAAQPFTPAYWLFNIEGALLLDRFLAGILLFSALYFQWQISSQTHPIAIIIPLPSSDATIQGGRVGGGGQKSEFAWVWRPSEYWTYTLGEAILLALANWSDTEILRRLIVVSVIAGLWGIGWFVTPESMKRWAFGYIKTIWYWIVVDEILGMARGQTRRTRRRN